MSEQRAAVERQGSLPWPSLAPLRHCQGPTAPGSSVGCSAGLCPPTSGCATMGNGCLGHNCSNPARVAMGMGTGRCFTPQLVRFSSPRSVCS